jgi:hypothetical protein
MVMNMRVPATLVNSLWKVHLAHLAHLVHLVHLVHLAI